MTPLLSTQSLNLYTAHLPLPAFNPVLKQGLGLHVLGDPFLRPCYESPSDLLDWLYPLRLAVTLLAVVREAFLAVSCLPVFSCFALAQHIVWRLG